MVKSWFTAYNLFFMATLINQGYAYFLTPTLQRTVKSSFACFIFCMFHLRTHSKRFHEDLLIPVKRLTVLTQHSLDPCYLVTKSTIIKHIKYFEAETFLLIREFSCRLKKMFSSNEIFTRLGSNISICLDFLKAWVHN